MNLKGILLIDKLKGFVKATDSQWETDGGDLVSCSADLSFDPSDLSLKMTGNKQFNVASEDLLQEINFYMTEGNLNHYGNLEIDSIPEAGDKYFVRLNLGRKSSLKMEVMNFQIMTNNGRPTTVEKCAVENFSFDDFSKKSYNF